MILVCSITLELLTKHVYAGLADEGGKTKLSYSDSSRIKREIILALINVANCLDLVPLQLQGW